MPDGPEEFLEIFSAQRSAMLLLAKHNRVIEIEDDPAIGAVEKVQLEFIKTDRLEKYDDIMTWRLAQNPEPFAQARASGWQNGRLNSQAGVVIDTIAQAKARAGRIPVFDYAKDFHSANLYCFYGCHSSG